MCCVVQAQKKGPKKVLSAKTKEKENDNDNGWRERKEIWRVRESGKETWNNGIR